MEHIKTGYDIGFQDPNKKYEYFAGTFVEGLNPVSYEATMDCVIPIKGEPGSHIDITENGQIYEMYFEGAMSDSAKWVRVKAGKPIKCVSEKKFFWGNPIPLKQEIAHKYKLVLFICMDSFVQMVLGAYGFRTLMPHTSTFFSNSLYMRECYCCADWTLPAAATLFTGKYPYEHRMVHPDGGKLQHMTFTRLFKDAGYLTGFFNTNWRIKPEYGYIDDFDRGIYCYGENRGKCISVIEDMIDHLYAFPDRDHFITLGLLDLHSHFLTHLPHEIGIQINEDLEEQAYRYGEQKTPEKIFSPLLAGMYRKLLKFVDYKLQILYNFLSLNYAPNEYVVLLCGDHGDSRMYPPDYPFDDFSREKWLRKDIEMKQPASHRSLGNTIITPLHQLAVDKIIRPVHLRLVHQNWFWPHFKSLLEKVHFPFHLIYNTQNNLQPNIPPRFWPHFQSATQKTSLLIKGEFIEGEQCDILTDSRSVYNIFSCLLSNPQAFTNDTIKTICKRKYVYNESIYPGQTYKAKILDDTYVFYFESEDLVDNNCMLSSSMGHMSLFLRENYQRDSGRADICEKYYSIVQAHISHLIDKKGSC